MAMFPSGRQARRSTVVGRSLVLAQGHPVKSIHRFGSLQLFGSLGVAIGGMTGKLYPGGHLRLSVMPEATADRLLNL
ncbi:MAG: hypothetical protein ACKPEY_15830 [Planctomycetota bacterium]